MTKHLIQKLVKPKISSYLLGRDFSLFTQIFLNQINDIFTLFNIFYLSFPQKIDYIIKANIFIRGILL
ncbi:hypothetical protein COE58_00675 [Bacillus cereus]|nr:hypothetical protein COE58_00675 [Bacillus cereus]